MAILTMETRLRGLVAQNQLDLYGLGDLTPDQIAAVASQQIPGAQYAYVTPSSGGGGEEDGATSFLSEYGVPIAAGVASFAIGLVIAKLASQKRGKKR